MGIIDKIKKSITDKAIEKEVAKALSDYNKNIYHRSHIPQQQKDASSGGASVVVGLAKRLGIRFGDITGSDYEDPEYELEEIDSAYDSDSYVRQGVDKYIDQMFKEGYGFYGKNPNAVEYIETRLKFMSATTQIPLETLLIQMAECIVKYSNVMLAKSRMSDQTQIPAGLTVTGLDGAQPVVGYFPIHPSTLKAKRDKNGLLKGWQQDIDGTTVNFKPADLIHIAYKQRIGYLFGTPFLIPVLDDIKALRFLEENCINMVYKNVNPFLHTKVGYEEQAGGITEVNQVKNELDSMDVDSGIVTTNRVEIVTVGTDNAVNAEPYLRYLEERVFSGLGVSAVDFGRGNTANRNTADSMTDEKSDKIKAFQQAVETGINNQIIRELLMEGGFDPLNNPDDIVTFEFLENDMDRKIKSEAHAVFMYENNAYTEDEMRDAVGKEPITDRAMMYQTLITQANMEFEASLQPTTPGATSSSSKSSTSATKKSSQASNKVKPTNQHGTKTSPKKNTNAIDLILSNNIKELASELCVSDMIAKTIIHTLKKSINTGNLKNENYVEYTNERIENLAKVFRIKR